MKAGPSRPLLPVLGACTVLLTMAAIGTSAMTFQRQRAMNETGRYQTVFDVSQLRAELLRLRADTAVAEQGAAIDPDRLQDDLQAITNQTQLLQNRLADNPDVPPELRAGLAGLQHLLAEARPLIATIGQKDATRRLLHLLAPEDETLARSATSSFWQFSARSAQEETRLTRLYWACLALIMGLVISVAGLVGLLIRQSQRSDYLAQHDPLTGLPNRLLFRDRLEDMLTDPDTAGNGLSVMFIDLDDFKDVNDSLGHVAGDMLLREVSRRLQQAAPDGVVARLGGDEFAVMLPDGGRVAAADLAERLTASIAEPVELDRGQGRTSASIGIATRRTGIDAVGLLKQADLALYEAKAAGRGTFHFYDNAISARLQTRLAMEADIRAALGTDQFYLAYQPLVQLNTGRIIGFEALLRWNHPTRGAVPPVAFIPVAEECGLILPLGTQVLRRACQEAARWHGDIKVAVNLSPRQFKTDNLLEVVRNALAESGLPPHRLELEITESALLQDGEAVQATLHALRELGVHMALDDFGTGYSSLSYLQRFPFDKIKIDQSFVRGMAQRPESVAIVELISNLAQRLGMSTTAEGIEDEKLLKLVLEAGCREGQGYHFDRPLKLEDAILRLDAQRDQDGTPNVAEAAAVRV